MILLAFACIRIRAVRSRSPMALSPKQKRSSAATPSSRREQGRSSRIHAASPRTRLPRDLGDLPAFRDADGRKRVVIRNQIFQSIAPPWRSAEGDFRSNSGSSEQNVVEGSIGTLESQVRLAGRLITGQTPRHASRREEQYQHPSLECGTSSELGRRVSPAHGSLARAYVRPNSRWTRRDMGVRAECTGQRQAGHARRFVACAVPLRAPWRPRSPVFPLIDLRSDPALGRPTASAHRLLAHALDRLRV